MSAVTHDQVVGFVSRTDPGVEVTLNHGAFALPGGFIVEVATSADVTRVFYRAQDAHLRIVAELASDGGQFSMLDLNGHCVTVASADRRPRPVLRPGSTEAITDALPGVTTNDLAATRAIYVDLLGFDVGWERDGTMQLRSPVSGKPELIVATNDAGDPGPGGGFSVGVDTIARLEALHRAAVGKWTVMHGPVSFEGVGIRLFSVLDPNSAAIDVAAPL